MWCCCLIELVRGHSNSLKSKEPLQKTFSLPVKLFFGGAYLRREICVSKSNGLAFYLEVNLPFLLCFTLYLRAIFKVQAPGGLIFGRAI